MSRLLARLGSECVAHPLRVVMLWVAAAGVAVALAATVGAPLTPVKSLPGTEVAAADTLLQAHFPAAAAESADVVLAAPTVAAAESAARAAAARVRRLPHVLPQLAIRRSADGRTCWLHVRYDVGRFVLGPAALHALEVAAGPPQTSTGVRTAVAGQLAIDVARPGSGSAEKVGVAAALLVLVLAFGSVVAALLPVLTAGLAIVTGLSLVHLLALAYPISDSAPALATMLGLGAGIDYALFIVTRHREATRAGVPATDAAVAALASAGTSVTWAGITVVAAICGLAFAGIPLMTSLGFAAAVVVAVSVLAALTLMPALLALLGPRLERLHVTLPRRRTSRAGWAAWAHRVERRPALFCAAAVTLLAVLSMPVASLRLGMPDGSAAAPGSTANRAFVLIARGFGAGANAPLQLVVTVPPAVPLAQVEQRLRATVAADPAVQSAGPMRVSPDGAVGVLQVLPAAAPQSAETAALVPRLRTDVLPPVEAATGAKVYVTGLPAGRYDVGRRVVDRLPWFVGAVLLVSFGLLAVVFRSVLVPVKAVLLNLLSIAAALGVVVAVFQWGWLNAVVGVREPVPLVDVIPMMMFAIVFGLSMDYEVFLLSRVREEWLLGGDGRGSVARGLASTAHVITAAAAIMVAVFLAFTLADDVVVKMMGLGLAVAVLLDATVIRLMLVPATMALLGDLNWWLPRWLDRRLPHVAVGAAVPVTPAYGERLGQPSETPMPRPTP